MFPLDEGFVSVVRPRTSEKIFDLEWSALINSLPDVYLVVDRDGKILFINRGENGAGIAEVLEHTVFDYVMGDFHAQLKEKLDRVYGSGCQDRIEVKRSDPDFAEQWWSIAMSPLRRGDEVVGVLFLCRDVTDMKNVRQEQERSINSLKQKFWRETSAHDRAREILIEEIAVRREAEKSLSESEQRYRELVENARNAIFSVNYEGFLFL